MQIVCWLERYITQTHNKDTFKLHYFDSQTNSGICFADTKKKHFVVIVCENTLCKIECVITRWPKVRMHCDVCFFKFLFTLSFRFASVERVCFCFDCWRRCSALMSSIVKQKLISFALFILTHTKHNPLAIN